MILDEIRRMKKKIDNMNFKIKCFTFCPAIRYDKEFVQAGSSKIFENVMMKYIELKNNVKKLRKKMYKLIKKVPIFRFTERQLEFISLFYFQGLNKKECAGLMKIKISAVSRLYSRIKELM